MRLSEVLRCSKFYQLAKNLGIFRRKIPDKRCYQSRGEAESLQGVVRLKEQVAMAQILRVGRPRRLLEPVKIIPKS